MKTRNMILCGGRSLVTITAVAIAMCLPCGLAFAQKKFTIPPEALVELAKSPTPPPSNDAAGIDIDAYIGNPFQSPVEVLHGAILVRSILTHGDPARPVSPGAVLQYRQKFSLASLLPHTASSLAAVPHQTFFFVQTGEGRIDDGEQYWELKPGIAALVPPGLGHRLSNTGDDELQMSMLTWTPQAAAKPAATLLVRDVNVMPFTKCGDQICHWSYFGKNLFNSAHGLNPRESFHVVWVPPMSIGEPHAHVPGWEEVWTKLPPYDAFLTLGSEVRDMPVNTAFLAPPNAKTVHAVMNLRKDSPQAWLFIGTFIFDQPEYGRDPLVPGKPMKR